MPRCLEPDHHADFRALLARHLLQRTTAHNRRQKTTFVSQFITQVLTKSSINFDHWSSVPTVHLVLWSSVPTVPLYQPVLSSTVPQVHCAHWSSHPLVLCALWSSVPTGPLDPPFLCSHCFSGPLFPLFLCSHCSTGLLYSLVRCAPCSLILCTHSAISIS